MMAGEKKVGWLSRKDGAQSRIGVAMVFGAGPERIDAVLRLQRWLNMALSDYRPILFFDTEMDHPFANRVRYWEIRRFNQGWSSLAMLPGPRVYFQNVVDTPDLDARGQQRLKWAFQTTGAHFILVVPEGTDADTFYAELPRLRSEICMEYLETA